MAEEMPEKKDAPAEPREASRSEHMAARSERMSERMAARADRMAARADWRANRPRYRSFFWPLVFISVGALWLLVNLNVVPADNLWVLVRLWPLIFIIIGLDLLVGRRVPWLGALLGLGWVVVAVALVLYAPALGLLDDTPNRFFGVPLHFGDYEVEHKEFTAPVDGAESADVRLDLSLEHTEVSALSGSDDLIVADLDSVGNVRFEVSGRDNREIRLDETDTPLGAVFDTQNLLWDIGLNPDVPMALDIDVGSGPATLELDELQVTGLKLEGGSGPADVSLPGDASYGADVDVGSGPFDIGLDREADVDMSVSGGSGPFQLKASDDSQMALDIDGASGPTTVTIGDDSDFTIEYDGGSGPFTVEVPGDAAVRLEVQDEGTGPVNVPGDFRLVDDGDDNERNTGTWETEGFDDAAHQIIVTVRNMGSGPVTINR